MSLEGNSRKRRIRLRRRRRGWRRRPRGKFRMRLTRRINRRRSGIGRQLI
jgi:hypothetical protein